MDSILNGYGTGLLLLLFSHDRSHVNRAPQFMESVTFFVPYNNVNVCHWKEADVNTCEADL
jgi:hypothetical protein